VAYLTRKNLWLRYLALASLILLSLTPVVHAGVGLEYLGPNPLRPQPVSGQSTTLQASAIVGNTGNETAIVTFTLIANQDFMSHFTYSFSDNNFSLSPGARKDFNLTLTFDPNTTPAQDYTAAISIVASPTSKTGTSGSAAFNLPVAVSGSVVPEFPNGAMLPLFLAIFAVLAARRRIKSNRESKNETGELG
jgi:hypothetical protein